MYLLPSPNPFSMGTLHLLLPLLFLLSSHLTTITASSSVIDLTIQQFYDGVQSNTFDLIIDVRTEPEWSETGHVPNATFIPSLQDYEPSDIPLILQPYRDQPCRHIVVYCKSGGRANTAAQLLIDAGFEGIVYNGLGVKQWNAEGYDLVRDDSFDPLCRGENTDVSAECDCGNGTDAAVEKEEVLFGLGSGAPSGLRVTGAGFVLGGILSMVLLSLSCAE